MKNNIKLSFCIATYNRASFIGATLASIISQATDEVEIVIVDGASQDNTKEVVQRYGEKFPGLRYYCLEAKGGVDQDYNRAVEFARGEYCWLMSDDDILKENAVHSVLEQIRRDYDLIIVNAEIRNEDLTRTLVPNKLKIQTNRIYKKNDYDSFLADTAQYLSFIGCVVIKWSLWNSREKEKYFGTLFIHVGVIFQSPIQGDILVISEPLISIRYGNANWINKSFEIWMFKWPNLIWSFSDFSDTSKRKVTSEEPWRSPGKLLILRAFGCFNLKEYNEMIEPRACGRLFRFVSKTIARLPGCLLNVAAIGYFSIVRRSPDYLLDLKKSRFYYRRLLSAPARRVDSCE